MDVPGALTLDHIELMTETAAEGLGIAYVPELSAQPYLDDGRLMAVLSDWCPSIAGLFLYYPGRRHVPAALRAFIEVLRETIPRVDCMRPSTDAGIYSPPEPTAVPTRSRPCSMVPTYAEQVVRN